MHGMGMGMGMESGMGSGMGSGGGRGRENIKLPLGYAVIRGEVMETRNKLVQRGTPMGTNYFSFESLQGPPIFQRHEKDIGRRFILFEDRNYPAGDGHYIILRKMFGAMMPGQMPQAIYEAFHMSLGESISGMVMNFDKNQYMQNRNNQRMGMGGYGGNSEFGGSNSYPRMKRKDESSEKVGGIILHPMNTFPSVTTSSISTTTTTEKHQ